jgi:hypothetical protein
MLGVLAPGGVLDLPTLRCSLSPAGQRLMPVYPIDWKPLLRTGDYPHMAPRDLAIWETFLDALGDQFDSVAYDVAFGGFLLDVDAGSEAERLGWRYSTALKADAVLSREGEVWMVEVKPSAGVSAIGAALCYREMAIADGFTTDELVAAVVTDHASPDIQFCAEVLGVTLVAVEAPR